MATDASTGDWEGCPTFEPQCRATDASRPELGIGKGVRP